MNIKIQTTYHFDIQRFRDWADKCSTQDIRNTVHKVLDLIEKKDWEATMQELMRLQDTDCPKNECSMLEYIPSSVIDIVDLVYPFKNGKPHILDMTDDSILWDTIPTTNQLIEIQ